MKLIRAKQTRARISGFILTRPLPFSLLLSMYFFLKLMGTVSTLDSS